MVGSIAAFAQPANDNCSGAIDLLVAATQADCVPLSGDTRMTTDGANAGIPNPCSVNFMRDDVWYKVVAPDPVPSYGWTIKFEIGSVGTDVTSVGFALYNSCDAVPGNVPLYCAASNPDGELVLTSLCPANIIPGNTYYLRVWSGTGSAADYLLGAGTFRVCAFLNEDQGDGSVVNVLWGDQPGEGDFGGGLNGWTTEGVSCGDGVNGPVDGSNALWQWDDSGLPYWFFGGLSPAPIKSRTYCNGSMIFDSGLLDLGTTGAAGAGTCPAPHEGSIISPVIDLSGFDVDGVSLLFHQSMQRWREGEHWIDLSYDGGATWSDSILINSDLTYSSTDPSTGTGYYNEEVRVALPGAEGAANFRFRIRFKGQYYWWIVDDVWVIERECNNLRANDFYAISPNAVWHQGQLSDFGMVIDIENLGACDQTNVVVDLEIRNEAGDLILSGSKDYGTVVPDTIIQNSLFAQCFQLPADIAIGNYTGLYTVHSDSMDFNPLNDTQSFRFAVGNTQLSKDIPEGNYTSTRPGDPSGTEALTQYVLANHYLIVDGDKYRLCDIEVGLGNVAELTPDVIGTQASVILYLYEWNDINQNGDVEIASETQTIGFNQYDFQNGDPSNAIYTFDILDPGTLEPCVPLKNNTQYLVAMQYSAPLGLSDALLNTLMTAGDFNYNAVAFLHTPVAGEGLGSPCGPQFGTFVSRNQESTLANIGSFTGGITPVIRMNLDLIESNDNPIAELTNLSIMPNPVSDLLRVDMEFVRPMDRVVIRVADINGRILIEDTKSGISQESWTKDVSTFANGSYFLSIISEDGVRTDRFMIQR